MGKRIAGVLAVLALAFPVPAHSLTTIVRCDATKIRPLGQEQCTASLAAPAHTVNLRPDPGLGFAGTLDVRVTNGTVTHSIRTTWLSGRLQVDGGDHLTVSLTPVGSAWTLLVVASPAGTAAVGAYGGVIEA